MILEDYQKAIKRFCDDNKSLTIYTAGEISHPGISDLDFLVVDEAPVVSEEVLPYLMGGNVIIMPSFAMRRINELEQFNLKMLQGTDHLIDAKISDQTQKIIEILEWLPERILKIESSLTSTASEIDRNQALLLHKSCNRSIESVSSLVKKEYQYISTNEARENINIPTRVIMEKSLDASKKSWQDFSDFLTSKNLLKGNAQGKVEICDYYQFENTFDHLILYFDYMRKINSSLSRKLASSLNITTENNEIDEKLFQRMKNRWLLLSEVHEWFLEKNIERGMIKYGWYLRK